jgi:hypothetical protein
MPLASFARTVEARSKVLEPYLHVVERELELSGLEASKLVLEITESAMALDPSLTSASHGIGRSIFVVCREGFSARGPKMAFPGRVFSQFDLIHLG